MDSAAVRPQQNSLATDKVSKLILKFAIPAIIGQLVGALYNIVDQIFIGQAVGMLGNAATNVAFPLNTITMASALLIGIGTSSNFNLAMGAGNRERAAKIAANGIAWMAIVGVLIGAFALAFLEPLLWLFGATEQVFPYALTYTGITSLGLPFLVFSNASSKLIRADGSPTWSMLCTLSGAILNCFLDPLFIFTFDMGIAGGAWATVIGQIVSALVALWYFKFKFKAVELKFSDMLPKFDLLKAIAALGAASGINQIAMTFVQIMMNNTLTYYGALSQYGSDIPLACVGVISKVSIVVFSVIIGISQGSQPILGFNYGAKNYARVKEAYFVAIRAAIAISCVAFVAFQLFPRQIVAIFGQGSEEYFRFAERYMRIYMAMIFISCIQPITSSFFTSVGKAYLGIFMSLTRQVIFLIPLIYIFPQFLGIDGVMYAGPIADTAAVTLAILFMRREIKQMDALAIAVTEDPSLVPEMKPIIEIDG